MSGELRSVQMNRSGMHICKKAREITGYIAVINVATMILQNKGMYSRGKK